MSDEPRALPLTPVPRGDFVCPEKNRVIEEILSKRREHDDESTRSIQSRFDGCLRVK